MELPFHLCQRSIGHRYVGLSLDFIIPLIYMSILYQYYTLLITVALYLVLGLGGTVLQQYEQPC